jgi:hypothetical protein
MTSIKSSPALKALYWEAVGAFSYIEKGMCRDARRMTILRGIERDPRPAETVTARTIAKFTALLSKKARKQRNANS